MNKSKRLGVALLVSCWMASGPMAAGALAKEGAAGQADRHFTPDMTWDSIEALPRLDNTTWSSTKQWDQTVVQVKKISLVPPLKPEWQAKADDFVKRAQNGKAQFRAGACYPNGFPRSTWFAYPPSFIYKPGNSILITVMGETREIWMDGRPHPAKLDPGNSAIAYLGHSIGWWDGDTLVIDTVGFAPDHELFYDVPNGGQMHVVERYTRTDPTTLKLDVVIEDDARLARPWVYTHVYRTPDQPDTVMFYPSANRIDTFPCRPADSRENIDANGNGTLNLTPPPRGTGIGK